MISLVIPAYNEQEGLSELYSRIAAAARAWGEEFELILIDDGSRDRTLEIATDLARQDGRVKVISFSRNFGHQAAVTAGLAHASGDIVAVMDADLQDPPEELHQFIAKVREGYHVVYAIRTKRKEGPFKRLAYYLYYRILARMATLDIPLDAGDFCVMSSEVVAAINALPERNRFVRGLRTWVGYRQVGMAYERAVRFAGDSKYTLSKLLKLASDGIINFSYRPLQIISLLGGSVAALALVLALAVLVLYIQDYSLWGFNPRQTRGWTSLTLLILFSTAIQLISIGIIGEYIGRIFEETKQRPIYVVKQRINLSPPE
jgi:dolichol-phosphate mannosyltransferase